MATVLEAFRSANPFIPDLIRAFQEILQDPQNTCQLNAVETERIVEAFNAKLNSKVNELESSSTESCMSMRTEWAKKVKRLQNENAALEERVAILERRIQIQDEEKVLLTRSSAEQLTRKSLIIRELRDDVNFVTDTLATLRRDCGIHAVVISNLSHNEPDTNRRRDLTTVHKFLTGARNGY